LQKPVLHFPGARQSSAFRSHQSGQSALVAQRRFLRRERSSQPDATGSDLPKKRIILLPALNSRRPTLHAKPALVDFVMAELDRFAN
jgi:hypothetical protein